MVISTHYPGYNDQCCSALFCSQKICYTFSQLVSAKSFIKNVRDWQKSNELSFFTLKPFIRFPFKNAPAPFQSDMKVYKVVIKSDDPHELYKTISLLGTMPSSSPTLSRAPTEEAPWKDAENLETVAS